MAVKPAEPSSVDRVLALLRWFVLAVSFGLVLWQSPELASTVRIQGLAVLALAYCVVLTALAVFRIAWTWLPWASTILDVLFLIALVSSPTEPIGQLVLLPLIPVLSGVIYVGHMAGLVTGLMVAAFWLYHFYRFGGPEMSGEAGALGIQLALLLGATSSVSILLHASRAKVVQHERLAEERARLAGEQVQAICELTGNLSATLDYQRVLDSILDVGILGLQELGSAQRPTCLVLLFDEEGAKTRLHVAAGRQLSDRDMRQVFEAQKGVLGEVVSAIEPRIISAPDGDPELGSLDALQQCQSLVGIPIRAGFDLYGVLVFASKRDDAYGEYQLGFLNTLCSQAAIALQNARFYEKLQAEKQRIINEDAEVRQWLARELHDGPTQTISAVAMRLSYLKFLMEREPEKVTGELDDLEQMARRATREIRTTLFKLRPLVLESQGFRAALEQYAKRVQEEGGPKVQLDIEEPSSRLDGKVETTIFSIIEEAVNNARKHAKADSVSVRMSPLDNMLVVTIRDNGAGFNVQEVERSYDQRGSMGLLNMRERAELLGGRLEIESRPGFGTIVTLVVPLPNKI